jgi:aspartyl/asparaginyl beta-hydroxylase (cupin superfamily)
MSKTLSRPWLSDANVPYPNSLPRLYDPSAYDFVKKVEGQFHVIRDELLKVIQSEETSREFRAYRDIEKTNKDAAWKTAGLIYWTMRSKINTKLFPKTWAIFKDIPNVTSCSLHLLEPQAMIKPHIGDTDAMFRCHMGLIIPAPLPRCGFRVGDDMVSWEEGKIFIFNDACMHTAWNNTNENRYVISFDVMRPEYVSQRYWVASQVLGKLHVEMMFQHKAWLRKYFSRRWMKRAMSSLAKGCWRARIFIHNRLLSAAYG